MDMVGKQTLGQYFEELAKTHKDKKAIIYESCNGKVKSLSYQDLIIQINKSANFLKKLGAKKGERIILHLTNSIEYIINLIAIARIGAVAVPINANYVLADTIFIVQKTKPSFVITQSQFLKIYSQINNAEYKFKDIIVIDNHQKDFEFTDYKNAIKAQSSSFKQEKFNNLEVAQIIFTSGTSSFPKGVMITHYNMIFAGYYTSWQINLNKDDRYLTAMPLWHIDAQCTAMMPTFARGATLVLLEKYSAHKFWQQIIKHKATITECIPKMICTLLTQPIKDNEKSHKLREVLFYLNISQNHMNTFLNRFNIKSVLSSYGMSETIVGLIGDRPNEMRKFPSIGRVGFCYEAKIVGKNGLKLKPFECGEIYIRGEIGKTIFKGYYENQEETKKALSKSGWLHTGDIGYVDNDGYFYFVDRDINLIKVAGENVSSIEVECCIGLLDGVFEVAVIGIPNTFDNELIKAYIVLKEGVNLNEQDIKNHCSKSLAKFKVPSLIEFVSNLPKTCTGKVKKNILRSNHLQNIYQKERDGRR